MTRVSVVREEGHIRQLTVSGHAGYAEAGQDIVCAAVSILTTTCVNALSSVAGVEPIVTQDERTAKVVVALPRQLSQTERRDAETVMETALQGFRDLSGEYPSFCTILDRRKSP